MPSYVAPPGFLDHAQCQRLWSDKDSQFHRLWHAEGWRVRQNRNQPACWGNPFQYFDDIWWGRGCGKNWYTGNQGDLGLWNGGPAKEWAIPHFTKPAPALLGFDRNIDWHCHNTNSRTHATKCVEANVNILSLYGDQIPYNLCRNAEWQLCAARGYLPGQNSKTIMFSYAPRDLEINGGPFPLGSCTSYAPRGCGNTGYASGDIFYLEVCLYDQICKNGRGDLWALNAGDEFRCDLDWDSFSELRDWIITDG